MTRISDKELVLDLQRGDLEALGELYDRHRQLVFRTALAITGDPEAAADLLQDVFLRFHRFAHRVDPNRPIQPWLYRMTANMAYTWMKRRNRWMRYLKEMADWLTREKRATPQQQAEIDDEWRRVKQALAAISLEKRVVVVLYYVNDLAIHEIAEILDIPVGTVKSRLHYGRLALKKQLGLGKEPLPEVGYEVG